VTRFEPASERAVVIGDHRIKPLQALARERIRPDSVWRYSDYVASI